MNVEISGEGDFFVTAEDTWKIEITGNGKSVHVFDEAGSPVVYAYDSDENRYKQVWPTIEK